MLKYLVNVNVYMHFVASINIDTEAVVEFHLKIKHEPALASCRSRMCIWKSNLYTFMLADALYDGAKNYIWSLHNFVGQLRFLIPENIIPDARIYRKYWVTITYSNILGLTHWGRVTHICVSKQTIIGSDNGLSPGWHQAIIWTNAGILLIGPLGTNFSEILIEIYIFSFKKMHFKMSSGNSQPFCFGLNVLTNMYPI